MSSSIVKATDLVPGAFGSAEASVKEDDLTYDLHNLCASDTQPLDPRAMSEGREEYLKRLAQANAQLLLNRVYALERETTATGEVAMLPVAEVRIPREKPVPKDKPLTKWQKFALEKGIKKQKRSRLLYDDLSGDFKPRYGYQRALKAEDDWVIEDKTAPGKRKAPVEVEALDPFTKRRLEKKQRVVKNQLNHIRNLDRAAKTGALPSGIPLNLGKSGNPKRNMKGKQGTQKALEQVQRSTASMGKFDKRLDHEPERVVRGKKRRFTPVERTDQEREKAMAILKHLDQA